MPITGVGERMAWARNQQGLTQEQIAHRSGTTVRQVSKLERGATPNLETLVRVAKALGVPASFLLGESPPPVYSDFGILMIGGTTVDTGSSFCRYVASLPEPDKDRLLMSTVEDRMREVVEFLCDRFPFRFTRTVLAYQLGISVRQLNDILERGEEAGPTLVHQLAVISGVPTYFFLTGMFHHALLPNDIAPADVMEYLNALLLAKESGLTPEELTQLVKDITAKQR